MVLKSFVNVLTQKYVFCTDILKERAIKREILNLFESDFKRLEKGDYFGEVGGLVGIKVSYAVVLDYISD